jgi:CRISPR system Cascade subunit CasB
MVSAIEIAPKSQTFDEAFVEMLEELYHKNDRAALAALRRGLGRAPGEAMESYRYIARFAAQINSRRKEESLHIVATLFSLYPSASRGGDNWMIANLGASLRELRGKLESEGVDRRFVALLNSHRDELATHLRQIVSLLKSKEVTINWLRLLRDINRWDDDERDTQRKWAKAFWREARNE